MDFMLATIATALVIAASLFVLFWPKRKSINYRVSKQELQKRRLERFGHFAKPKDALPPDSILKSPVANGADMHSCKLEEQVEHVKASKREGRRPNPCSCINLEVSGQPSQELIAGFDGLASQPVVQPLKSLEDLLAWVPGFDEFSIGRLKLRKVLNCERNRPRTLVCHDMKGGYLEDRFSQGFGSDKCYHFQYWMQIDLFVYFSHSFVTIPPPCWTNAAHAHGVKSLGTIITEHEEGAKLCAALLEDQFMVGRVVDHLVEIACYYNMDGWLVNIENEVQPSQVSNLELFVKVLTEKMHQVLPNSEVIWYDSVIFTGNLKWQNKLCTENRMFFDACDGIFLNYNWGIQDLQHSLYISGGTRQRDVYVGVDVFGRGCFGGGGFNSCKALQVIREMNLSVAIFAPGWVKEVHGDDQFAENQHKFWELLMPYLYPHCLADLPLVSTFSRGFGNHLYINGSRQDFSAWTNLSAQSLQPSFTSTFYQLGPKGGVVVKDVAHTMDVGLEGGGCMQITGTSKAMDKQTKAVFRLFRSRIPMEKDVLVSYAYTTSDPNLLLYLMLLFEKPPQYAILGEHQKEEVVLLDSRHASTKFQHSLLGVAPEQISNYEFYGPLSNPYHDDVTFMFNGGARNGAEWKTRNFVLSQDDVRGRVLEEVRLVVATNPKAVNSDECERPFVVNVGEVRIMHECGLRLRPCPTVRVRCRDVAFHQTSDPSALELSATLSWDYDLDPSCCKPMCYDVFCKGEAHLRRAVGSPSINNTSEPAPLGVSPSEEALGSCLPEVVPSSAESVGVYLGRAYADSFRLARLRVAKNCGDGLQVTIQSISECFVRQSVDETSKVLIKWK